ncbi:MAG: hypothetical protein N2554_03430 [Fimbriimonadales bacterium]|nr:hypothetical protein [Fimbriimonadales bacterium]
MQRWTIGLSLSLLGLSGALAIPETVVFMPTANLNSPRSVYLATEQYGVPRYYSQTRTRCLYTQLMVTERFDFGVDFWGLDSNQPRQTVANARFVLTPESKRSPGFSVGALNITENANPTFYLVGTQTTSFGRFHLGAYRQGERMGWSGAYQTKLPFGLDVAVEYFKFPDGTAYTSFGAGRQVHESLYLYTYYARHHQTRDADLFGVYLAFTPFRLF